MDFKKTTSLYASPVFIIYAGPTRKLFVAHATVLYKSPTLRMIVDGDWKDSKERKIDFAEWDETTIHQLIDFLHTGHYKTAITTSPPSPNEGVAFEVITSFTSGSSDVQNAVELSTLKDLAFGAIEVELESTEELQPQLLANIVQLARYVYTSTDTLVNSTEQLRDLVATFVGNWFHAFQGPIVNDLMEEGGEFVVDIMQKVQQHVKDMNAEHKEDKKELQRQIKRYQTRLKKKGDGTCKEIDDAWRSRCHSTSFPSSIYQAQLPAISATILMSPDAKVDDRRTTSAFSSRVFEIFVGPTERVFYAHADILVQSDVLRMIVQGGGKETEEGKLVWPVWTVSGAEKLLEWLYTGDYKCPYPTKVSKSETVSTDNNVQISGDSTFDEPKKPDLNHLMYTEDQDLAEPEYMYDDTLHYPKGKKKSGKLKTKWSMSPERPKPTKSAPRPRLMELTWSGSHPLEKLSEAEEFDKWTGHQLWRPDQLNYETTFMTHAELYNMACTYQLDTLKNMAWQRLRSVLVSIGRPVPGSTVIGNVVNLIHYTYEITGEVGSEEEPLRKLVTTFATLNFTRFKGSAVDELMKSASDPDREFVTDLMSMVRQKVDSRDFSDPE
ncbi:MAG: hypothetical protein Q9213_000192 [Squamulea squamosa]